MRFGLTTCYRREFLPVIVAFVTETARCLGGTERELSELAIAAEEAGLHIIEHFPGEGLAAQFEVFCDLCGDTLQVIFSNMGLPVNEEALPRYEAAQPEETIDGLGLFLIGKMVDRYEFVNRGREGWRTRMVKRLSQLRAPVFQADVGGDGSLPVHEALRIMPANLGHVPGIVELAYRSYGYSYSKEDFYYADQLRDALAGGRISSFVALTPDDRVVGNMAILSSPVSPEIAEVGAVMIQPEYRRSLGLLKLLKVVSQEVRGGAAPPALVETNLVTTHTLSQKACDRFNFIPLALKLSAHGQARFVNLAEEAGGQRETLLHAVAVMRPVAPVRLHVPEPHVDLTRRLFTWAGITLEIAAGMADEVPEESGLEVASHADAGLAVLTVRLPGRDLADQLHRRLYELESDGIRTVHIRLPGWLPTPPLLDEGVRPVRIFFSGWVVAAPDRWWLQYTRLNGQRFEFDRIQLHDPRALELREYVADCFRKAVL